MLTRYSVMNPQLLNSLQLFLKNFGTQVLMLKKELRKLKAKQIHSLTLFIIQMKFRRDTTPWYNQQGNRFFFFYLRLRHIEEKKKSGYLNLSTKLLHEVRTYGYYCQLTKK